MYPKVWMPPFTEENTTDSCAFEIKKEPYAIYSEAVAEKST